MKPKTPGLDDDQQNVKPSMHNPLTCCWNCDEWEMDEGNVHRGYCPVFDKHSRHDHGAQCTAWRPGFEFHADPAMKLTCPKCGKEMHQDSDHDEAGNETQRWLECGNCENRIRLSEGVTKPAND